MAPTVEEERAKHDVVESIRVAVRKAFPEGRGRMAVRVFGSFASGMGTWDSDVDLVVTGLFAPDASTGGYDSTDRTRVAIRLRKLADVVRQLRRPEVAQISVIGKARIPIIKLRTRNNIAVDISISDASGVEAATYLAAQAHAYPPLAPLITTLKAYLRHCGLGDVASGGLSSYSLANMVIAHMQEELKDGRDIFDLGETLYSFFVRYGEEFDYERDAVSVHCGGIVPKAVLPCGADAAAYGRGSSGGSRTYLAAGEVPWWQRLTVECPLSVRDVSGGSHRIDEVAASFERGAAALEAASRMHPLNGGDGGTGRLLSSLFDVSRALQRVFKASSSPYFEVIGGRERLEITAEYGQGDGADDDDDVGSSIRGNGGAVGATGDDDDHGDELARVPTSSARGKGGGRGGRGGSGQPRRA